MSLNRLWKPSETFAVDWYLIAMADARSKSHSQDRETKRESRLVHAALREARIFSVDPDLMHRLIQGWWDAAESYPPWPDRMPFGTVWLGYDGSCSAPFNPEEDDELDQANWSRQERVDAFLAQESGSVIGQLVTTRGDLWSFVLNDRGDAVKVYRDGKDRHYADKDSDFSEIAFLVLAYINQQRTVVEQDEVHGLRRRMKTHRKALGLKGKLIPPPYYRVRVRSRYVRETVAKLAPPAPREAPAYRHDVRGHERCRIRRGPLPLDPKIRTKLEAVGYKIFTVEPLDSESLLRMIHRRVRPKAVDEWIAIKTSWIDAHISPNDDELPYVPAERVVRGASSSSQERS